MQCFTYCLASQINVNRLEQYLLTLKIYKTEKQWNGLEIQLPGKNQCLYVFTNGTLVTWGLKKFEVKPYYDLLRPFCLKHVEAPIVDGYSYSIGGQTTIKPHAWFHVEMITLQEDDREIKLSLSYGFSQSIKLKYYESRMEKLVERYNPLIQELYTRGKMSIQRRRMREIIGEILAAKSEINLVGNFLYQPKFFWQHPNLEKYYIMLERYLDIPERAETLNEQLNTLSEVFDMFHSHLESRHASFLEIIIIVLIGVEIIFSALNLYF
jgi:uncharacterized Rmd1/YagE family protein